MKPLLLPTFALLTFLNVVSLQSPSEPTKLLLSTNDLTVIAGKSKNLTFSIAGQVGSALLVNFYENHENIIVISPNRFPVPANSNGFTQIITISGEQPGRVEVVGNSTPSANIDDTNLLIRIVVANSSVIVIISVIVGWVYFVAWSVSFYPQIVTNFKRKSVVGLNFDFLALNLLGHTLYAIFNSSLYWITYIEEEYFQRFPRGLNPVEFNDVVFSIHASVITALTIGQCFIYERGEQRVSNIARGIIGVFFTVIIVSLIITFTGVWHWLDFLNACSYIKLTITLIKYVPQAVMNYNRKSTVGWSIGNILLDFTGGMLSMLQMMLNAYNYNDWRSIFGDPTKFGLGFFSVLFDILFIVQHYFLYRNQLPYQSIPSSDEMEDDPNDDTTTLDSKTTEEA